MQHIPIRANTSCSTPTSTLTCSHIMRPSGQTPLHAHPSPFTHHASIRSNTTPHLPPFPHHAPSGQTPLHAHPPPSRTMRPSNRLSIHHRRYLRIVLKKPAKIKLIIKSQLKCNPLYRLYRHIQLPLGLRHNPFRNQVT